jgi:hypothetical protein
MQSILRYTIFLSLILISGCGILNAIRGTECSWVKPISVSRDDKFTRLTEEEIVAHNEKVKKFCK